MNNKTNMFFQKAIKLLLVFVLLVFALPFYSQNLKERRVYYLDCSYSMVTLGLWDKVRENLMEAIDKVEDETTELMVIPFAFDAQSNPKLQAYSAVATRDGKAHLKSLIKGLAEPNKNTMTYHNVPIKDFMVSRVNDKRVTYLFLMTDGDDEDKAREFDNIVKNQWTSRYGQKDVYGFYVMLDGSAKDSKREQVIDKAPNFWTVETADVNIRLIRFDKKAVFNIRNDKYMDLTTYGNLSGLSFNCSFDGQCPYKITKSTIEGNKLRIFIDSPTPKSQLPAALDCPMSVRMSGGDKYTFLVTDKIVVNCKNEKEYSLKVTVK